MYNKSNKTILVAPLNWGLGHATRCIPVIKKLVNENNNVIIASDGDAFELLKKEFPYLPFLKLPSYNISYIENKSLVWHLLKMSPKIHNAIKKENDVIKTFVKDNHVDLIISDNRMGVYHNDIFSVYITHQTNIKLTKFSVIANKVHHHFMKKFNEIWIPDYDQDQSLAGVLSNFKSGQARKYIGPLSRFNFNRNITERNNILVILSGPEPQRSYLEEIIKTQLIKTNIKATIVLGKVQTEQTKVVKNNVTIYNYMTSKILEREIQEAKIIIARSGYSTIMDLFALRKKAILIPTPGQPEQLYLAHYLKQRGIFNYEFQQKFNLLKALEESVNYSGFKEKEHV
ncbi:MAG: glycosyltransferase [Ichthyobacteriaceae bacterium]|nr:glycosyltransferase [Ichthyobacteriaceae bacterium]